jgi:nitroreductase
MLSPFATKAGTERLIHATQAAPSVLNTQPWSFVIVADDRIELRRIRHLEDIDPRHREQAISVGAALFNLRMAIRVTGHDPVVWLLPDEKDPDLLASVEIVTARTRRATATEQDLYGSIPQRHTSREPFRGKPIGMNMVAELEQAARAEKVYSWLLHRRQTRRLLRMMAKADLELTGNVAFMTELRQWTKGDREYGVPDTVFGPLPAKDRTPVRDLGIARSVSARPVKKFEKKPRLIGLATETDGPLDWLRTGQALQRLLLTATGYNVEASFVTQPFEINDIEDIKHYTFTHERWPWPKFAQIVIRLGCTPTVSFTPREDAPKIVDRRPNSPLRGEPPQGRAQSRLGQSSVAQPDTSGPAPTVGR